MKIEEIRKNLKIANARAEKVYKLKGKYVWDAPEQDLINKRLIPLNKVAKYWLTKYEEALKNG